MDSEASVSHSVQSRESVFCAASRARWGRSVLLGGRAVPSRMKLKLDRNLGREGAVGGPPFPRDECSKRARPRFDSPTTPGVVLCGPLKLEGLSPRSETLNHAVEGPRPSPSRPKSSSLPLPIVLLQATLRIDGRPKRVPLRSDPVDKVLSRLHGPGLPHFKEKKLATQQMRQMTLIFKKLQG